MIRTVAGVILGIVAGYAGIMAFQALVNLAYPMPSNVNIYDRQQMEEVFRGFPAELFAFILVSYLIGAFVGGYLAKRIARRDWAAWMPAVLIAVTAGLNILAYPHPVWAQAGGIVAPLIGGWLASRMAAFEREDRDRSGAADAEI